MLSKEEKRDIILFIVFALCFHAVLFSTLHFFNLF